MTKISMSLVATLLAGTSMVHASQIQSSTPSAQNSPLVQQAAPFIELAQAQTEAQKKAAIMAEEAAKKAEMMAAEEATKKAMMMAADSCDTAEFSVTGFSNAVDGAGSVSEIAAQINLMAGDNACAIEITGYSSTAGAKDLNMSLSTDRAEWVKAQLMEAGLNVSATLVTGAGETRQFGKNSANRRVVISVK